VGRAFSLADLDLDLLGNGGGSRRKRKTAIQKQLQKRRAGAPAPHHTIWVNRGVTWFMARFPAGVLLGMFAAVLWAQQPPSSPRRAPKAKTSIPDPGAIRNGVYRNSAFGFSYKIPYGWVDRTTDLQDDSADASRSRLLLAFFERPPEATGDTINSAVVMAAEPLSPGIKTAAEYFESLSALTTAKGFQAVQDPQEISVGATKLVRGDFSRARGTLTMRQTSLVRAEKGYAISFTFIGGSEDEVNELIEKLSFGERTPPR
jgi:hypothetical protein